MYAGEIEGRTFTFGVSGKLIMNALVMYDHQTESLWSHFTGDAVQGLMQGTRLTILPALQTDWQTWLELHPDTLALEKSGRVSSSDPYTSYYLSDRTGIMRETVQDDRRYAKEFVVGVEVEGQTKAYPFIELNETPVVNDSLNGLSLAVVFDASSATALVYDREVAGQTLTFSLLERQEGTPPKIRDQETGTTWAALTGEGLEGPLASSMLRQVPSNYSFWFSWKDYHPDTELYGG